MIWTVLIMIVTVALISYCLYCLFTFLFVFGTFYVFEHLHCYYRSEKNRHVHDFSAPFRITTLEMQKNDKWCIITDKNNIEFYPGLSNDVKSWWMWRNHGDGTRSLTPYTYSKKVISWQKGEKKKVILEDYNPHNSINQLFDYNKQYLFSWGNGVRHYLINNNDNNLYLLDMYNVNWKSESAQWVMHLLS